MLLTRINTSCHQMTKSRNYSHWRKLKIHGGMLFSSFDSQNRSQSCLEDTPKRLHKSQRQHCPYFGHSTLTLYQPALIASHRTKSRVMPSFAPDPGTEMKLVRQRLPDLGHRSHRKDTNHLCYNAGRTTFAITNQLLCLIVETKRPILVSMGANSISSNWGRTYDFVERYHTQHGDLIMVVRVTDAGMHHPKRTALLRVLCPYDIDGQSFGLYTSTQCLQDQLCQGLVE